MGYVIIKTGIEELAAVDLATPVVLGRDDACDISVKDPMLSRRHLRLEPSETGWVAIDLRSTNGTRVEGQRIDHHPLTDGDVIDAGGLSLVFYAERPPTIPPSATPTALPLKIDFTLPPQNGVVPPPESHEVFAPIDASSDAVPAADESSAAGREKLWVQTLKEREQGNAPGIHVMEKVNALPRTLLFPIAAVAIAIVFFLAFSLTSWITGR